jgi:hypothetical protein
MAVLDDLRRRRADAVAQREDFISQLRRLIHGLEARQWTQADVRYRDLLVAGLAQCDAEIAWFSRLEIDAVASASTSTHRTVSPTRERLAIAERRAAEREKEREATRAARAAVKAARAKRLAEKQAHKKTAPPYIQPAVPVTPETFHSDCHCATCAEIRGESVPDLDVPIVLPVPVVDLRTGGEVHTLKTEVDRRARAMDQWAPWGRRQRYTSRRYEGYRHEGYR